MEFTAFGWPANVDGWLVVPCAMAAAATFEGNEEVVGEVRVEVEELAPCINPEDREEL